MRYATFALAASLALAACEVPSNPQPIEVVPVREQSWDPCEPRNQVSQDGGVFDEAACRAELGDAS